MKKVIICLSALVLFSCKDSKNEEQKEVTPNSEIVQTEEQPTKEVAEEIKTEVPLSTKTLNNEVISVTKARVTGKVFYVEVKVKSTEGSLHVMNIKEINYIDDAEAKKHEVLKDDDGIYQASPLQGAKSSKLQLSTNANRPEVMINLRFAAPPESSKTITLNLPDFGSFDAIPITR